MLMKWILVDLMDAKDFQWCDCVVFKTNLSDFVTIYWISLDFTTSHLIYFDF